MSNNLFNRFAPFIQEWIYSSGWEELREIQVAAADVIFNSSDHLLLSTGTASGKTEAAFLPALTLLYEKPSSTIGILYISPLKALINDQFSRLEGLLEDANIRVWRWHGDVPQDRKQKLMKNPSGVLQITPESIESILINKNLEIRRMLGDLQFIIIDEVHSFMNSDRGSQILSQLKRIASIIGYHPRRIGLSATLGDYSLAEKWLASGTSEKVQTPIVGGGTKKIRLAVEHFINPNPIPSQLNPYATRIFKSTKNIPPAIDFLYEQTLGKKSLIFTNSREQAESVIATLRDVAARKGQPDNYHVHHGSIAGALRESTEASMREDIYPTTTAATITLELGIDIGTLERIIQLNAPRSVTSFLQRLGRSGRRSNVSEILFVHSEDEPSDNKPLPYLFPWDLLQSIAIIQLYLEEKWIEPLPPPSYPFSLLYHQTMSILASSGELSSQGLAKRLLDLPPFRKITQDDFNELIQHLLEIQHIEQIEDGGLIVGLEGEKIIRNYHFYAVFQDSVEWTVKQGANEIGKLGSLLLPGERFPLAGFMWEVQEALPKQRVMLVKKVAGRMRYIWPGDVAPIHTRVVQKIRKILFEINEYSYLQPGASLRLNQARKLAREVNLDSQYLYMLAEGKYCLFPWLGTTAYRTLERVLKTSDPKFLEFSKISGQSPYYLRFECEPMDLKTIEEYIQSLVITTNEHMLYDEKEKLLINKFDEYLPLTLQQKSFIFDHLDLPHLKQMVKDW